MTQAQMETGRSHSPARDQVGQGARVPGARGMTSAPGLAVVVPLALAIVAGCARGPHPAVPPSFGAGEMAGELRRTSPGAISASVRIRLEPEEGTGITIDGTLKAIPPDTLSLSARLGVFRPFFVLRADADSAELLLHEARRFWITARSDEDWTALNPSVWARAIAWALSPADLLDRLDNSRLVGGDGRVEQYRGELRGTPFEVELGIERGRPRLVSLRVLDGEAVVLQLLQRDFRRVGRAWIPGFLEMRMPRHRLTTRIEVLGVSASRFDPSPALERLRPKGWEPVRPGEAILALPAAGHDPG
jgi:hypothetical protein